MRSKNIVYHGTNVDFDTPDISKCNKNSDFGQGFYLTEDLEMAKKWVSRKKGDAFVYEYDLNYKGLKTYKFEPDLEWLAFICINREYRGYELLLNFDMKKYEKFDVLIGPVADDRMFNTITDFFRGYITAEEAITYLNYIGFSYQIVLKNDKAIANLVKERTIKLTPAEKNHHYKIGMAERQKANDEIAKLRFQKTRQENIAKINALDKEDEYER